MYKKILDTIFGGLLISLTNLYERMMCMGSITTQNGTKITVQNLAVIFANGIMWEIATFNDVHRILKSDVALILYVNGFKDLILEQSYLEEAKKRIEAVNG